jgi:hypothetical protein
MFASRSDVMVRTKSHLWVVAVSFLVLLFAALFAQAPPAQGATAPAKSRAKAAADSAARAAESRDEGISVRVVDGKASTTKRARISHANESTDDEGAAGSVDKSETPDAPDAPDIPEPPDQHDNDLVRFGQDIEIPEGKVIDGSVVAIGGSIHVLGRVKGDCTAVGGSVSVSDSGVVNGDAVSVGGSTTVSDDGRVLGSNVSVGGWPMHHGHAGGMIPLMGLVGLGAIAGIVGTFIQLLITLFLAWLCLLLARERMEHAVDRMGAKFGKSFLWGLVAWMAMIVIIPAIAIVGAIAMVILVITIIGIPVAILLAIALVFALIGAVLGIIVFAFLGYVNGAMYLGRAILARRSPGVAVTPLKAVVVGTILILGLKLVGKLLAFLGLIFVMPIGIALGIASVVLGLVLMTAGMGAMVLTRFQRNPLAPAAAPASPAAGWYAPPPSTPPASSTPPSAPSMPPQPPPASEGGAP